MKLFNRLLFTGLIAGSILGIVLKGIEAFTGKKVYVLLLNVDYISVIREWEMTEVEEFLLHLGVSILIVFALYVCLKRTWQFVLATVMIGVLYFPLTALSERTPDVADLEALAYWLLAHAIYGLTAGALIFFKKDRGIQ